MQSSFLFSLHSSGGVEFLSLINNMDYKMLFPGFLFRKFHSFVPTSRNTVEFGYM